jgi:hypothetical protein
MPSTADPVACGKHTPAPTDYLAWHAWAERKLLTHDQFQCPGCGLWKIWKRKKKEAPNAPR